jgi:transposase
MHMNSNMILPGLEGFIIRKTEIVNGFYHIHVELERKSHRCPSCESYTNKVHDYRLQRVQNTKFGEYTSIVFYRKRRYVCPCGKRFFEKNSLVERYQRHSITWNQALRIRAIRGKTFKETAQQYGTSSSTVMRRFDQMAKEEIKEVVELPPVIAIDEYKGDTDKGKFQLIIADGETRKPLDILPNRSLKTIKNYLRERGAKVQIVIMDMSYAFKSAVQQALGNPVIVADRFHFCRYIYWALDRVRRRVQVDFHPYDRKKCKRVRHIFFKSSTKLNEEQKWMLNRYLSLSDELKRAYYLKEEYRKWFEEAKEESKNNITLVKENLMKFYQRIEDEGIDELLQTKKTFMNWQTEILNSFVFDYSNGFLEGINNLTKVMKRNAYGYRRFDRFRSRILLHHQFKDIGTHIG